MWWCGTGSALRLRRRRAKPGLPALSASPCQCSPPQCITMLKYIPEQLLSSFEGLVLLSCHCRQCVVVWTRKYRCGGIAAQSRLRLRPPPLLGYRSPVTISRASSEPRDDSHVLVERLERLACAYHRAQGPGVGAGSEAGVGGECRRKCSSPAQVRGRFGPVGHGSYSRSMLSMQTRASVR